MRVVCIDDKFGLDYGVTPIVVGNIYTVVDTQYVKPNGRSPISNKPFCSGKYFKLIETGYWYHESLFIPINENQQDETEFQREYNLIKN